MDWAGAMPPAVDMSVTEGGMAGCPALGAPAGSARTDCVAVGWGAGTGAWAGASLGARLVIAGAGAGVLVVMPVMGAMVDGSLAGGAGTGAVVMGPRNTSLPDGVGASLNQTFGEMLVRTMIAMGSFVISVANDEP